MRGGARFRSSSRRGRLEVVGWKPQRQPGPGATTISTQTPSEQITEAVTAWPGVETAYGRRGEIAFSVGRRELGHVHGDHTAHFAFPRDVWLELEAQGRIIEHPVFPGQPGPAARRIEEDTDVRDVIELMRLSYDRIVTDPTADPPPETDGPGRPRDLDYGPGAPAG